MVELSVPRLVQRLVAARAAPAEAVQHELFLALGEALAKALAKREGCVACVEVFAVAVT